MTAFNNVTNNCYVHCYQYYLQYYLLIKACSLVVLRNRVNKTDIASHVPTIQWNVFNKSNID